MASSAWLTLFSPLPQHIITSSLQFIFLILFLFKSAFAIARTRHLSAPLHHQQQLLHHKREIRVGFLYPLTLCLVSLSSLAYLVLFAWKIWLWLWPCTSPPPDAPPVHELVFLLAQTLAWISFVALVACLWRPGAAKYPPLLRAWWVANFAASAFLVGPAIARFVGGELAGLVLAAWLDDLAALVTFPFATCLFALSVDGRTGLSCDDPTALKTPLLEADGDALSGLISDRNGARVGGGGIIGITGFYRAGFFSKATFLWLNPLLSLGIMKPLEAKDVPRLSPDDQAENLYSRLMLNYSNNDGNTSLKRALFKSFIAELIFTACLAFIKVWMLYVGPFLIRQFTSYVAGNELFPYEGIVLVLILLAGKCTEVLCSHHYNFYCNKLGMMMRSSLITAIYRKGLRLSSLGRQAHGTGPIVNYMSVDVQQISDSMLQINNLWGVPLHVVVGMAVLYSAVGVSCFAGLAVMVTLLGVSYSLARVQRQCQGGIMRYKDQRMAITTELLNDMKIVKLQAWEEVFWGRVEEARRMERYYLAKFIYFLSCNIFSLWLAPVCVSTATFACCILVGVDLTSATVFTAISTFRVLQEPLRLFPQALMSVSQALNSLDRLEKFMQSDELDPDTVERLPAVDGKSHALHAERGTFIWDRNSEKPTLHNLNVNVPVGSLVCIVGQVGSGKSTLLCSLLGEVPKIDGTVKIYGRMAYVAQTSWIQNATIKENILFGKPMDEARYVETLRVCSLRQDLDQLPSGDQTEIGERGINLSGGQKQRIQLARAVYQDADIYMLDDVFSAVDAHTGSSLFTVGIFIALIQSLHSMMQECIKGALSKKTVLLVTHQIDFLHGADQIWVMREGEIVQCGNYEELFRAGLDFRALVAAHDESMDHVEAAHELQSEDNPDESQDASDYPVIFSAEQNLERQLTPRKNSSSERLLLRRRSSLKPSLKQASRLIEEEERETGQVSWHIYVLYLTKTFKGFHVIVIVLFQACWQGLQLSSDYFLSYSTANGLDRNKSTYFISTYGGLALGSVFFVLLRTLSVSYTGLLTSQSFFLTFLNSVLRAPMTFFDTTPAGRILSRFTTDQTNLDIWLPLYVSFVLSTSFVCMSSLVVIVQVTWYMIFIIVPLSYVYICYQRYYITTSRELTRIDNITKAPIIHHFSETIAGFVTIRAFQEQERFKGESQSRVDSNLRMDFHNNASNEWLGFRLEMIGTSILCMSALLMVTIARNVLPSNLVGLSLSYGLALNSCLYSLVYMSCQLENRMVSVERINQYSHIPSEAPSVIEGNRPDPSWPSKGQIVFRQLKFRYRPEAPLVLKGISLNINGGEKVGVVGRTGSGKSTLILALFRIVEPVGGEIVIDGIDIGMIGLRDLRSKFGIIPQDPTLFEGTIRSNMDPLGIHSDEAIWRSLEKCQLAGIIKETEEKLDSRVLDSGENWSMGQRQLFCLGRALLNKNRILMLDEATASVDAKTDLIMQKTIQEDFHDCTVISIAHRIASIMDSDKVLVLDSGKVMEFDSPSRLLDNPASMFSALVREYTSRSKSY